MCTQDEVFKLAPPMRLALQEFKKRNAKRSRQRAKRSIVLEPPMSFVACGVEGEAGVWGFNKYGVAQRVWEAMGITTQANKRWLMEAMLGLFSCVWKVASLEVVINPNPRKVMRW